MKSLVITNMFPSDRDAYAGIFVQREVAALRSAGVDVDLCHIDTPSARTRYVTSRPEVRRAIDASNPDLVHVHFGLTLAVVPAMDIPLVVTFHGSDLAEPWKRSVSRAFLRKAAGIIVVAEHLKPFVADLGVPVTVVPMGVESRDSYQSRAEARAEIGLPPDATVALFPASAMRRVKRYGLFEAAVAAVPRLVPLVLSDVAPERVPVYLSAADVVVLTSEREGSPVVTKEALCAGARVVSVPVGDMGWQLEGMSGCALAAASTPDAIAAAIRSVLAAPPPDAAIARKRFDIAREAEAVVAEYERVLRG